MTDRDLPQSKALPWTPCEKRHLEFLYLLTESLEECAAKLGRSVEETRAVLTELRGGVPLPNTHTPYKRQALSEDQRRRTVELAQTGQLGTEQLRLLLDQGIHEGFSEPEIALFREQYKRLTPTMNGPTESSPLAVHAETRRC